MQDLRPELIAVDDDEPDHEPEEEPGDDAGLEEQPVEESAARKEETPS